MEPTKNQPMPKNPEPTDEVQLHIETVTPDTEKDAGKKETQTDAVASKEVKSEDDAKDATDNPKAGGEIPTDNPVHKKGEGDDPSDEIETVSP